jgi:hypothetical protein
MRKFSWLSIVFNRVTFEILNSVTPACRPSNSHGLALQKSNTAKNEWNLHVQLGYHRFYLSSNNCINYNTVFVPPLSILHVWITAHAYGNDNRVSACVCVQTFWNNFVNLMVWNPNLKVFSYTFLGSKGFGVLEVGRSVLESARQTWTFE